MGGRHGIHVRERFAAWLEEQGCSGLDRVELSSSDSRLRGNVVTSRRRLEAREAILAVPCKLLLDAEAAKACDARVAPFVAQHNLEPAWAIIVAVALLASRGSATMAESESSGSGATAKSEHPWSPYFGVLPRHQDMSCAILLEPPALQGILGGTSLLSRAVAVRAEVERVHALFGGAGMAGGAGGAGGAGMAGGGVGLQDLRWAHAIYWSRALVVPLNSRGERGSVAALVPLLDSINHRPGSLHVLQARYAASHGTDSESKSESEVVLEAQSNVAQAAEVFINYGAKTSAELVLFYGFAIPDNPATTVRVCVGGSDFAVSRGVEVFPQGMLDAARISLGVGEREPASASASTPKVYPYQGQEAPTDWARLLDSEDEEMWWHSCNVGGPISDANERAALALIACLVQDQVQTRTQAILKLSASPHHENCAAVLLVHLEGEVECLKHLQLLVDKLTRALCSAASTSSSAETN